MSRKNGEKAEGMSSIHSLLHPPSISPSLSSLAMSNVCVDVRLDSQAFKRAISHRSKKKTQNTVNKKKKEKEMDRLTDSEEAELTLSDCGRDKKMERKREAGQRYRHGRYGARGFYINSQSQWG